MLPWHPESKLGEGEQREEEEHFWHMLHVFASYEQHTQQTILRKYRRDYEQLSREQRALLSPAYEEKMTRAATCTRDNQLFFDQAVNLHRGEGQQRDKEEEAEIGIDTETEIELEFPRPRNADDVAQTYHYTDHSSHPQFIRPTQLEMDNMRSCLRQLMREWSDEGRPEREACYRPILEALEEYFPRIPERATQKVLVPGAGLGRLPYEISQRGFICQGNEISLFMLLPSQYLLTVAPPPNSIKIYPWALPFSNTVRQEEQFRVTGLPDIEILPAPVDFSMVAGDFMQVYGDEQDQQANLEDTWDAIVTCFFLDTARNVLQYMELINRLLAPGGIWINQGTTSGRGRTIGG